MGTTKLEKATRIVREYRELTEKEKSAAGSVLDEEERCSRALSAAHWIRRKRGAVLVSLDPSVEFAYFAAPAFGRPLRNPLVQPETVDPLISIKQL